jgi:hypothetical protein
MEAWASEEGIEVEIEWNPREASRSSPQTLRVAWTGGRVLWKCRREPLLVDAGQEAALEAAALEWFSQEVLPHFRR